MSETTKGFKSMSETTKGFKSMSENTPPTTEAETLTTTEGFKSMSETTTDESTAKAAASSTTTEAEALTTRGYKKTVDKKTVDKKTVGVVAIIAVVATFANALIMQGRTISDLNAQLKIANMRADVNNEFANDILLSTMNSAYQGTSEEIVRGQGRIEGIVQAINPDNQPDYTTAWHDGYDRGLNQIEDEKQSFYSQGYRDAKLGKDLRLADQPAAADVVPAPQRAVLKK